MLRLKDKSLPWKERLKEAKKIFVSANFVPRKEQAIIDWILFSLQTSAAKGDLDEKEIFSTWKLLDDIVSGDRIKGLSSRDGVVVLKPSLLQALLGNLTAEKSHVRHVIHCLYHFCTESCFHTFLYLPADSLIQLVSACCNLVMSMTNDEKTTSHLSAIINALVTRLQSSLYVQMNITATVLVSYTNRLLIPAILASPQLDPSDVTIALRDHVLSVLLHKDSLKHYERYMREKQDISNAKKSNYVLALFQKLREGIQHQEQPRRRELYLHFISDILEAYLRSCSQSPIKYSKFDFFKALIALTTGDKSTGGELLPTLTESVDCWARLLAVCGRYDMYNYAADDSSIQSDYHSQLVKKLCSKSYSTHMTSGWFHCLSSLLSINHSCIQKNIKVVVRTSWQTAGQLMSEDTLKCQLRFLCDIVSTYSKLRQIPKLIDILLETVYSTAEPLSLPVTVLDHLGELVTQMPATLCLDTWITLTTSLIDRITQRTNSTVSQLNISADLISRYTKHMRLYDNAIAQSVKEKLPGAVTSLDSRLINLLKNTEPELLPALLLVTEACCSVSILASHYLNTELSPLHSLDTALMSLSADDEPAPVNYCLVVLLLQWKARFLQLSEASEINTGQLQNTMSQLLEFYDKENMNSGAFHSYGKQILSIDDKTMGSAMYSTLLDTPIAALVCSCGDPPLISKLAQILLMPAHHLSFTEDSSCYQMFTEYLNSWLYLELSTLHPHLVSATIEVLSQNMDSTSKQSKSVKKRKSQVNNTLVTFLRRCQSIATTAELVSETDTLLETEFTSLSDSQYNSIRLTAHILYCTPLESLSPNTLGVITSLCLVMLRLIKDVRSNQNNVVEEITDVLVRCASSVSGADMLQKLNTNTVIHQILYSTNPQGVSGDILCGVLVKLCLSEKFTSLLPMLEAIGSEIKTSICSIEKSPNRPASLSAAFFISLLQNSQRKSCQEVKSIRRWRLHTLADFQALFLLEHSVDMVATPELCALTKCMIPGITSTDNQKVLLNQVLNQLKNLSGHNPLSIRDSELVVSLLSLLLAMLATIESYSNILMETSTDLWATIEGLFRLRLTGRGQAVLEQAFCRFIELIDGEHLKKLTRDITSSQQENISSTVNIIRCLITVCKTLGDDGKQQTIETACVQFVLVSQHHICVLSQDLSSPDNALCLTALIELLADIFSKGKKLASSQSVSSVLIGLQFVLYDLITTDQLLGVVSSCSRLLKTLLLHLQTAVHNSQVPYQSAVTRLLTGFLRHSNQNKYRTDTSPHNPKLVSEYNVSLSEATESMLISCCQEINKVLSTMSTHRQFMKCSVFIVADMLNEMSGLTLLPTVKKALHIAVNPLLDMCDEHSVLMLKMNLPEAQREMFKTLYEQYKKYHKYSGRV